jgi:hypothetical protein
VQIMSPHFLAQPDKDVVVPQSRWYAPPAQPPIDGRARPDRPSDEH